MAKTILTVDDELNILELLKYNLEKEDYNVIQCDNGGKVLDIVSDNNIDLILLDIMLPEMDGIEILKKLKQDESKRDIPVILLTAKSEELDKVIGLELGADDYIAKPFGVREMLARVKAVLRRNKIETDDKILKRYDITIDLNSFIIKKGDTPIDFTLKEFELLKYLITHEGKVISRETLLEKIWGYDYLGETRTVDVHIRQIRKKIEENDKEPYYILTVRGVGYKFRKE